MNICFLNMKRLVSCSHIQSNLSNFFFWVRTYPVCSNALTRAIASISAQYHSWMSWLKVFLSRVYHPSHSFGINVMFWFDCDTVFIYCQFSVASNWQFSIEFLCRWILRFIIVQYFILQYKVTRVLFSIHFNFSTFLVRGFWKYRIIFKPTGVACARTSCFVGNWKNGI